MTASKYRPDIDGLRAVAVLSVLFYHLDVSAFSGGFVGVDVFFVISGYLITGLIKSEYDSTNTFNFFRFYVRRFKRIFPALFVTSVLCIIPALLLFSPTLLSEFFGSLVASLASVSNIYFWSQVGYFDTNAHMKPLLHTWSLSVEEQYYLIAPAFGLLALKTGRVIAPLLIAGAGILSLLASMAYPLLNFQYDMSSTIFYMMPFRVFEFVIGAMLVWIPRKSEPRAIDEFLLPAGLAMIACAVFFFSNKMIFPFAYALLPCLGTALAIYSGKATYAGKLLCSPPAVGLGLISYSLYLVHWPFIVFYRYATNDTLSAGDKFGIVAVSIVSAYLLYRFVEQRFRYSPGPVNYKTYFAPAIVAALAVFVAAVVWSSGGWRSGYPPNVARQLTSEQKEQNTKFTHFLKGQIERDFPAGRSTRFLVVGDSMAGDFINLMNVGGYIERFDVRSFQFPYPCPPTVTTPVSAMIDAIPKHMPMCDAFLKRFDAALQRLRPTNVVLAFWWEEWELKYLEQGIQYLKDHGVGSISIIGLKSMSIDGTKFLTRYAWRENIRAIPVPPDKNALKINARLREIARRTGVAYFEPYDFICPKGACEIVDEYKNIFFFDAIHLSKEGTAHFGPILSQAWGEKIFGPLSAEAAQSDDKTPMRQN